MNKRAGGCGRQSLATRSRLARHPPIVRVEPARSTPLDVDHVRGVQALTLLSSFLLLRFSSLLWSTANCSNAVLAALRSQAQ